MRAARGMAGRRAKAQAVAAVRPGEHVPRRLTVGTGGWAKRSPGQAGVPCTGGPKRAPAPSDAPHLDGARLPGLSTIKRLQQRLAGAQKVACRAGGGRMRGFASGGAWARGAARQRAAAPPPRAPRMAPACGSRGWRGRLRRRTVVGVIAGEADVQQHHRGIHRQRHLLPVRGQHGVGARAAGQRQLRQHAGRSGQRGRRAQQRAAGGALPAGGGVLGPHHHRARLGWAEGCGGGAHFRDRRHQPGLALRAGSRKPPLAALRLSHPCEPSRPRHQRPGRRAARAALA
jgi:hypothetical protein